ncbi:MAG: hypothetical protein AB2693_27635 [Candidatus Thiodiazotropha sp.]
MVDACAQGAPDGTNVPCVTASMQAPCAQHPVSMGHIKTKEIQLSLPTPVKPKVLGSYLDGYNQDLKLLLTDGFLNGFPLGIVGSVPLSISSNHPSAFMHAQFVEEKLKKELSLHRIISPHLLIILKQVL